MDSHICHDIDLDKVDVFVGHSNVQSINLGIKNEFPTFLQICRSCKHPPAICELQHCKLYERNVPVPLSSGTTIIIKCLKFITCHMQQETYFIVSAKRQITEFSDLSNNPDNFFLKQYRSIY